MPTATSSPPTGAARPSGWAKLLFDLRHRRRRFRQLLGFLFVFLLTLLGSPALPWLFWSGVAVASAGMAVRMWASGFVRKNEVLATNGPYAHVRHPLYTGNLTIALGFCIASGLWWSLPLGALFVLTFYPQSIAYEDRKLAGLFPDEWGPWAGRTPALVPRVRPRRDGGDGGWTWSFRQSLFQNGEPIYVLILGSCLLWLHRVLVLG